MQVAFEKGTHYFWTVSKDKMLKYWDGDKVRLTSCATRPELTTGDSSSASRNSRGIMARSGRSR